MHKGLGMQVKLIIVTVLVIVIVMTMVSLVTSISVSEYFFSEKGALLKDSLFGLEKIIQNRKGQAEMAVVLIADNDDVQKAIAAKDAEKLLTILKPLQESVKLDFITVTDAKGDVIVRTHESKRGDSVTKQANVTNALQGKVYSAFEPGTVVKLSARAGAPVKDDTGKVIGVISAGYDVATNGIVDELKELYGVEDSIFIDGVRIASTVKKENGERVNGTKLDPKVISAMMDKKERLVDRVDVAGYPFLAGYQPVIGPDGGVVAVLATGVSLKSIVDMRNQLVIKQVLFALLGIVFGVLLLLWIVGKIVNPIRRLQILMQKAGDGDLTVRAQVESNDEVGALVQSFNKMMGEQSKMVNAARKSSVDLSAAAEMSAAAVEQVNAMAEEVSDGMARSSESAREGALKIVDAVEALAEMVSMVEKAKESATQAGSHFDETDQAANEGRDTVGKAIKAMRVIEGKSKEATGLLNEMSKYTDKISNVADVITGIAGQTNLLALNAAIEAARAGEAGRGFSVVAEEVRKLAEESNNKAHEVTELVHKIVGSMLSVTKAIEQNTTEMANGVTAVDKTGVALNGLLKVIDLVLQEAEKIITITDEEMIKSEKIVSLINNVRNTVENADEEAQMVSKSMLEVVDAMTNITASSEETTAMAQSLRDLVDKFKV